MKHEEKEKHEMKKEKSMGGKMKKHELKMGKKEHGFGGKHKGGFKK